MATLHIPNELIKTFINYVLSDDICGMTQDEINAVRNHIIEYTKELFTLKSCPFLHSIAGEHRVEINQQSESGEWYAECSCGAETWDTMPVSVIDAWNKRTNTGICPWCGGDNDEEGPYTGHFDGKYQVECANEECHSYGPRADTKEKAERLWKRQDS